MLTMTRLASDSFLPSGGLDSFDRSMTSMPHLHGRPDSVITPLALPNSIRQHYFDALNAKNLSPPNHLSDPSLLLPSQGHHASSSISSPFMAPTNPGLMSPLDNLSPRTAALFKRKEEYIRRQQENWLAERAHLEASRTRTEEMFREERDFWDEERTMWNEQKTKLESEILDWKHKTEAAENEVARLTKLLVDGGGIGLHRTWDGAGDVVQGRKLDSPSSPGTGSDPSTTDTLRALSDDTPTSNVPYEGLTTIPESNPFVPLDPRMQSIPYPFFNTAEKEQEKVPSIDINEVIPGLEGIRVRVPAVQKSTFSDERPPSPMSAPAEDSPLPPVAWSLEPRSKTSPAVMTRETLLASAHHRLTMHAGHTPSHSISFSQVSNLGSVAGTNIDSHGTCTPKSHRLSIVTMANEEEDEGEPVTDQDNKATGEYEDVTTMPEEDLPKPTDDDPALKGPLCLKNRPAADEVFLRRLSDKLEEVKATDAEPAVLSTEPDSGSSTDQQDLPGPNPKTSEDKVEASSQEIEDDIPLILKKSTNFGQPLGQARRGYNF